MKKAILLILTVIILVAAVACHQPASASELKSDKPRETATSTNPADLTGLANGNSALALNLYQLLRN